MSIYPKVKRLEPGYYEMTCGEVRLRIWRESLGSWGIRPYGSFVMPDDLRYYRTYTDARNAAYEWCQEYA